MLDAAPGLVIDDAHQLDQRRAAAHAERLGDGGRGEPCADALARVLDLDAGALKQFEQRPRRQFLPREGDRHALGHVRGEIGERQAIDRAHAHRALQQLVGRGGERLRHRAFRRHIVEREQLDRRAPAHVGNVGEHAGDIGGDRRRRRTIDDAGAGAAPPLDQPLARQFPERAAHGDARDAVMVRELVLGGQLGAEADRAAQDAVAQDQIDLLCLRFAEPVAHPAPLTSASGVGRFTWYFLAYNIAHPRQARQGCGKAT